MGAVQALEYEKWRDAELYDDIRDVAQRLGERVQALSSAARYERELLGGSLSWGFMHTHKFWAENVMKFEKSDAIKMLAGLLHSDNTDTTTLAVVCHDLGEFVALHPQGKQKV